MLLISLILAALLVTSTVAQDVQLPYGTVRGGQRNTVTGRSFFSFQGVPYAAPPVRDLRFMPPAPPLPWEGIRDVSVDFYVQCYQGFSDSDNESEDCLFVNIYTPQLPEAGIESKTVMVWFFGGAFNDGDNTWGNYGPEWFIDADVIVVTVNPRVGPFAYLSTGDDVIPGNAGLKDARAAIQWTHDHIVLFGGDPEKITIFGQSSGAATVSFQLLHTASEGLFRAAILQSCTAINQLAFQRNPRYYAFRVGAALGQDFNDNSTDLLQYLQSVDARAIDQAGRAIKDEAVGQGYVEFQDGLLFAPVIEASTAQDAIITEKMYTQLIRGDFVKVPIMMGFTSEEQISAGQNLDSLHDAIVAYDNNPSLLVTGDMMIDDPTSKTQVGEEIRRIYVSDGLLQDVPGQGIKYLSDDYFNRAIRKFAEVAQHFVDVYFYQFSYDGQMGGINIEPIGDTKTVGHAEDLNYMWRRAGNENQDNYPEEDYTTLHRMVLLWTNFAKYLNPTPSPDPMLQNLTWFPTGATNFQNLVYFDIDRTLSVRYNPKDDTYRG